MLFTTTSKIYWPLGAIQCSREYKKFLKSISIHFNCSFMQLEQQTTGHNNIYLLGVWHTLIEMDEQKAAAIVCCVAINAFKTPL